MTTRPATSVPARLRVGVKNTEDGGRDGTDVFRLRRQLATAAAQNLDAFGILEAKWWDADDNRILHQVEDILQMHGYLVPSNHHGCHLVIFIRPGAGISVIRDRRDVAPPWWHGLNDVEAVIDGFGDVHLLLTHLAPKSREIRLLEAQTFGLYQGSRAILMGDFNAAAEGENPSTEGIDPAHAASKLDRRPAAAIREAGFIDVGAHLGDPAPTVGHTRLDRLAYRCDRIYTTLPAELIVGHRVVIEDGDPDSDHRLVVAEFARPGAPQQSEVST